MELDQLVEKFGIVTVLATLAEIARTKADAIQETQPNCRLGSQWAHVANSISAVADSTTTKAVSE